MPCPQHRVRVGEVLRPECIGRTCQPPQEPRQDCQTLETMVNTCQLQLGCHQDCHIGKSMGHSSRPPQISSLCPQPPSILQQRSRLKATKPPGRLWSRLLQSLDLADVLPWAGALALDYPRCAPSLTMHEEAVQVWCTLPRPSRTARPHLAAALVCVRSTSWRQEKRCNQAATTKMPLSGAIPRVQAAFCGLGTEIRALEVRENCYCDLFGFLPFQWVVLL